MGKIEYIKKARKEHKCSKCGKVIEVGQPYKKGVINFHPDIVVCSDCTLKPYEVTTSEYSKNIGSIVEDWSESYGITDTTADEIATELESIKDELEDSLENIPDNLKEAPTGELLQTRIDQLEEAIEGLNDIDTDSIREEAEEEAENSLDKDEYESEEEYNTAKDEEADSLYEEKYSEAVDDALSVLEY